MGKIRKRGRKYNPDDTNFKHHENKSTRKNNKRKLKGSKRNQKKKHRRQQIINRKKMELKDLLRVANNVELPDDRFHPRHNWQ